MPSGYQAMWLFAMFDLPTDTKAARKQYARFRKSLVGEGFSMLQYSVYARYFSSEEEAEPYRKHIELILPPDGQVRILAVTEKQFAKQRVFYGRKQRKTEAVPEQMMLF